MDVDPALIDEARTRLRAVGYQPVLHANDGREGLPDYAPYDRVIATVAVPTIPAAWIQQTRPGGQILAPLNRGGALAMLVVNRDIGALASGVILPIDARFTNARGPHESPCPPTSPPLPSPESTPARRTALGSDALTDPAHSFEFFVALYAGPFTVTRSTPSEAGASPETWLTRTDGSWACHRTEENRTHWVREGGPALVWAAVERAHSLWTTCGQPGRDRFGITTWGDATTTVWLDHPDSSIFVALDEHTPPGRTDSRP